MHNAPIWRNVALAIFLGVPAWAVDRTDITAVVPPPGPVAVTQSGTEKPLAASITRKIYHRRGAAPMNERQLSTYGTLIPDCWQRPTKRSADRLRRTSAFHNIPAVRFAN